MVTDARLGSSARPVRVAIVGAGPAGFFTADALLRSTAPVFAVDVFERLPTPFGLVRAGVAPDHQKIKGVTRTFDRTAKEARFRFLGNVDVGQDVSHDELVARYDQVVYAVGSSSDRRLGIAGEEFHGCYAATAFVGWYNAHPDFVDFPFDLGTPRAVIVGVGNVALDIARILLRSPDELAKTDIADHALEALRTSAVREVVLLARRGPAQAAFDPGELTDVAALDGVAVDIDPAVVQAAVPQADPSDQRVHRNLQEMLALGASGKGRVERTMRIEFLASPVEVLGDGRDRVRGLRVERTRLAEGEKAVGTGELFELETGLVFRSVGYFGMPVPSVPFDGKAGIIPNRDGRVTADPGGSVLPGIYAVGWIRRGPLGVIGTNKADAQAVAQLMVADVASLAVRDTAARSHEAIDALLASRKVRVASYADWGVIDALEVRRGRSMDKVRDKLTSVDEMLAVLPPSKGSGS